MHREQQNKPVFKTFVFAICAILISTLMGCNSISYVPSTVVEASETQSAETAYITDEFIALIEDDEDKSDDVPLENINEYEIKLFDETEDEWSFDGTLVVLDDCITEIHHQTWGVVSIVPIAVMHGGARLMLTLFNGDQMIYVFPNAIVCSFALSARVRPPKTANIIATEIIDVNKDGYDDIIVIDYCSVGIGRNGALAHSYVSVFFNEIDGFTAYGKLDDELTYEAATYTIAREYEDSGEYRTLRKTTMDDVVQYIAENISDMAEYLADAEPYPDSNFDW